MNCNDAGSAFGSPARPRYGRRERAGDRQTLASHIRREAYPKSSSEVMNALKQDVGFDVDQSSNVKVLARTRRRTTAMKRLKPALPSNIMLQFKSKSFCHAQRQRSTISRRRCRSGHHYRGVRYGGLCPLFCFAIAMSDGRGLKMFRAKVFKNRCAAFGSKTSIFS